MTTPSSTSWCVSAAPGAHGDGACADERAGRLEEPEGRARHGVAQLLRVRDVVPADREHGAGFGPPRHLNEKDTASVCFARIFESRTCTDAVHTMRDYGAVSAVERDARPPPPRRRRLAPLAVALAGVLALAAARARRGPRRPRADATGAALARPSAAADLSAAARAVATLSVADVVVDCETPRAELVCAVSFTLVSDRRRRHGAARGASAGGDDGGAAEFDVAIAYAPDDDDDADAAAERAAAAQRDDAVDDRAAAARREPARFHLFRLRALQPYSATVYASGGGGARAAGAAFAFVAPPFACGDAFDGARVRERERRRERELGRAVRVGRAVRGASGRASSRSTRTATSCGAGARARPCRACSRRRGGRAAGSRCSRRRWTRPTCRRRASRPRSTTAARVRARARAKSGAARRARARERRARRELASPPIAHQRERRVVCRLVTASSPSLSPSFSARPLPPAPPPSGTTTTARLIELEPTGTRARDAERDVQRRAGRLDRSRTSSGPTTTTATAAAAAGSRSRTRSRATTTARSWTRSRVPPPPPAPARRLALRRCARPPNASRPRSSLVASRSPGPRYHYVRNDRVVRWSGGGHGGEAANALWPVASPWDYYNPQSVRADVPNSFMKMRLTCDNGTTELDDVVYWMHASGATSARAAPTSTATRAGSSS